MEYLSIGYNDPIVREFQNIRSSLSNESVSRYWRHCEVNPMLSMIISGLCYFNNTHAYIKRNRITRSTDLPYYFEWTVRPNTPSINYDQDKIYLQLTTHHVTGQIVETFERVAPSRMREKGYVELNGFSLALKTSPRHRIRVYTKSILIDEARQIFVKDVQIFTTNSTLDDNLKLYRKIMAVIPLLIYEDVNAETVDQNFVNILRSLERTEDADIFLRNALNYIRTLESYTDLARIEIVNALKGLNELHKSTIQGRVNKKQNEVAALEEQIREQLLALRTLQYELAGMSDTSLTPEELNMLIDTKTISSATVSQSRFLYTCQAPCLSFDKDAAQMYYTRSLASDTSIFKSIFKLAFIDEVIVIMFEDSITLDFETLSLDGRSLLSSHHVNKMRNPHHAHFNCWGNYATSIKKLMQQYNFIQTFLQIKAAVGALNMTDYTVLNYFKNDIIRADSNELVANNSENYFILWKEENDLTKFHSLKETIKHYKELLV